MIPNICRGLCVLNVLVGLFLVVTSISPSSIPGVEKSLISVMFSLIWATLFFVATFGLFFMLSWSRRFMIFLYGGCAFLTALGFLFLVLDTDPIYTALPGAVFSIYLLMFAFFLAPAVFMLHRDVKVLFGQLQDDRKRQDEVDARATFKRPE